MMPDQAWKTDLTGCVIVTGGASGIGLECVRNLLSAGSKVGVMDRILSDDLLSLGEEFGSRLVALKGDVSDEENVRLIHSQFREALGPADGLVCAAGILSGKPLRETSMDLWRRTFAVNVEGSVIWMQAVLDEMIERRSGSIVLFSSQLTRAGGRNNAAYIAAKSALVGLARTAALELASEQVRVNAVVPGAIDTPMLRNGAKRFADPGLALDQSRMRHPLGRFGTATDIANGVMYLLSPQSSFMTGAELVLDGGWSIG